VLLPGRRSDHDRAAFAAPASEPRPEPTHEPERDRSRPMFIRDRELARRPSLPDDLEGGHEKIEVDVGRFDA
jgi:hypothetical protein